MARWRKSAVYITSKIAIICSLLFCSVHLTGCGAATAVSDTSSTVDDISISTDDSVVEVEDDSNLQTEEPQELSIPAFEPLKKLEAPADVTEGREPSVEGLLPTRVKDLLEWMSGEPMDQVALLKKEGELSLYGLRIVDGENVKEGALLNWGGVMAEFDWTFGGPQIWDPQLSCYDVDGDGESEAIVINHTGSGTGVFISDVHIIKKTGSILTDYRFPDVLWEDMLSDALGFYMTGDRCFVTLGDELVDVSEEIQSLKLSKDDIHGFTPGYICRFNIIHYENGTDEITFDGAAMLDAEGINPTTVYMPNISAEVNFENGMFSLDLLHLDSYKNGGLRD